jgi:hypothetical protein
MHLDGDPRCSVTDSAFVHNSPIERGAIFATDLSRPAFRNCTFQINSATLSPVGAKGLSGDEREGTKAGKRLIVNAPGWKTSANYLLLFTHKLRRRPQTN